jgi:hypothetical protein
MRNQRADTSLLVVLLALVACTPTDEEPSARPEPLATAESESTSAPSTSAVTASPSTATETTMCTAAGCDSTLTIDLSQLDITPGATYEVEICVDGICTAATTTIDVRHPAIGDIERGETEREPGILAGWMLIWADDHIDYYLPEADYGSAASVTFTLTAPDGPVLAQTAEPTDVPLERSQPNGPECPPVCFHGRMTV